MSQLLNRGALGAVILCLSAGAGLAQPQPPQIQPPPEDSMLGEVTITSPRVVKRERYGVVAEEVKLSVRVPFGDLDMATPQGVAELDKRVKEAAKYVCGELDRLYPDGAPDDFYCAKEAVRGAQPQVILARGP